MRASPAAVRPPSRDPCRCLARVALYSRRLPTAPFRRAPSSSPAAVSERAWAGGERPGHRGALGQPGGSEGLRYGSCCRVSSILPLPGPRLVSHGRVVECVRAGGVGEAGAVPTVALAGRCGGGRGECGWFLFASENKAPLLRGTASGSPASAGDAQGGGWINGVTKLPRGFIDSVFSNEGRSSWNCEDLINHFIDVLTCNVIFREEKTRIAVKCESCCGLPYSTAVAVQAPKCQVCTFCLVPAGLQQRLHLGVIKP